ncbi:MAG: amidase [Actinobacteria bacterium]|nr:MAG: amidase [Actinomycetota bacterium]
MDRGRFLKLGAAAAAAPAALSLTRAAKAAPAPQLEEATIAQLQAQMTTGGLTSLSLVQMYLTRIDAIDRRGGLNSVLALNPDAQDIAKQLDAERKAGHVRGPLHGIPVMVKANIDTADKLQTTAGSLALVGQPAPQDSTVAKKLRDAGAVILGKTNLSEWANFRSFSSTSGWSGVGGLCHNPYALDRNAGGSSSGSGASTSANLCAAGLGTETDGSIVNPANNDGVVGIKPTVGLTSRAGVVPISHTQDTVGPHARTVADAAAILSAIASRTADPRDDATATSPNGKPRPSIPADYTQFLDPNGLSGAKIGALRGPVLTGYSKYTDGVYQDAIDAMSAAGATVTDDVALPDMDEILASSAEIIVLIYEFKRDLKKYLDGRTGVPIKTLADAIAFNNAHADTELKFFGQEIFELAESDPFSDADYAQALADDRRLGGQDGIDAALAAGGFDALVAPTGSPAWTTDLINGDHFLGASSFPSAMAGYPIINVPAGSPFGVPVGISFIAGAFSEPLLIKLASGFEAVTKARRVPQFQATLPDAGNPAPKGSSKRHGLPNRKLPAVANL